MSLIMAFVAPEFVVMCADKRICRNGNVHSEDFRKVYYFNNNIVMGFAGKVLRNFQFLSQYLKDFNLYCDDEFSIDYEVTGNISFNELCETLTQKFSEVLAEYKESQVSPGIEIMVGGFVEGESIVRRFYISGDKAGMDETKGENGVLIHLIFGKEEQENILTEKLSVFKTVTINDLQKVFQEVLNVSAVTNEGINNKMNAVFMERPSHLVDSPIESEVSSVADGIYSGKIKIECQKSSSRGDLDEFYV